MTRGHNQPEQDDGLPITHHVPTRQAMEVLDYMEMRDLSRLLQQWALEEENITSDRRTWLMLASADYEAIADFVGSSWKCTEIGRPIHVMKFVAQNAFPK